MTSTTEKDLTTEDEKPASPSSAGAAEALSPTSPSPGPSTIVIVLGDVVLLSQQRVAIVKYVGRLPNQSGIYYGVEIRMTEGPLGNCDGTYNDVRYFDCAPNCGLFAKYDEIERRIAPSELLEKVINLTKKNTLMHRLLQSPESSKNNKSNDSSKKYSNRSYSHRNVTNYSNNKDNTSNNNNNNNNRNNNGNNGNNHTLSNGTQHYAEISITQSDTNNSSKGGPIHNFLYNNNTNNTNNTNKRESSSHRASYHYTSSKHKNSLNNSKDQHRDAIHTNGNNNNEYSMSVSVISEKSESRRHSISNQNNTNNNLNTNTNNNNNNNNNNNGNNGNNSSKFKPNLDRPISTPARAQPQINESHSEVDLKFLKYDSYNMSEREKSKNISKLTNDSDDIKEVPPSGSDEDNTNNTKSKIDSNKNGKTNETDVDTLIHYCDFAPLYHWFDSVMDLDRDGIVSYNDWQYLLIELSPHLRYEIDSTKIQKCFNEFNLAKNNFLTKEECAVVMGKAYLRAIAKKKLEFRKNSKRKLEFETALLNDGNSSDSNNMFDSNNKKHDYLKNVSSMDVKSYFVGVINHMLKKMNATTSNANVATGMLQSPSSAISHMTFDPALRRTSRSLSSRRKPPPPKRSSKQLSISKGRAMSGATPPPPPPRKDSKK